MTHNASHEESLQSINDHNNHVFQINQMSDNQIHLTEEDSHHQVEIEINHMGNEVKFHF